MGIDGTVDNETWAAPASGNDGRHRKQRFEMRPNGALFRSNSRPPPLPRTKPFSTAEEKLEPSEDQLRLSSILRRCSAHSSGRLIRQVHARLITLHSPSSRISLLHKILSLSLAAGAGDTPYVRRIFSHLPPPKLFSVNTMLKSFSETQNPHHNPPFSLLKLLLAKARPRPNSYTFVFLLKACSETSAMAEGEQAHVQCIKLGLTSSNFVQTSLVSFYIKSGDHVSAREVFDEMPERSSAAWSALISGYVNMGMVDDALGLFREMQKDGVLPDEVTMVSVVSACAAAGALEVGRWVHGYVDRCGFGGDNEVRSALVNMYAKCGEIGMAKEVFEGMKMKDTKAWSSMIMGMAVHGLANEALETFEKMEAAKVRPNHVTFIGVLSACAHAGLVSEGRRHWLKLLQYQIKPSMELYGCMVDVLYRGNHIAEAFAFVESMPCAPNPIILRTLLTGCKETRDTERGERIAKLLLRVEPCNTGNYVLVCNFYATVKQWEGLRRVRMAMKERKVGGEVAGCSSIEVDGVVHEFVVGDWSHESSREIREVLKEISECVDCNLDLVCGEEM